MCVRGHVCVRACTRISPWAPCTCRQLAANDVCSRRTYTCCLSSAAAVTAAAMALQLYQVLTGRLPFWPRCTPDKVSQLPAWEVLAGARTREVTYPSELWASVSAPARDLVACMLDRRPGTHRIRARAHAAVCMQQSCSCTRLRCTVLPHAPRVLPGCMCVWSPPPCTPTCHTRLCGHSLP